MTSVLVVDDDTDLLEMVSLVLQSYDMKVNCINRGELLLDTITAIDPDILLMDIYLGDTDGRKLCHSLKSSEKFNHIPVILYSAGVITNISIQESLADDFLIKPFDITELVKKIEALA
jgi:DNA-binding response OmpR family regulator